MRKSVRERFEALATIGTTDECWPWKGCRVGRSGYGAMWASSINERFAHRVAYRLYVGEIPPGITVDHLCFNVICVNPWHMELCTRSENSRRQTARQFGSRYRDKTCFRGHKKTRTPSGTWRCLACNKILRRGKFIRKRDYRITDELVEDIVRSYANGENGKRIAKRLSVSDVIVYKVLRGWRPSQYKALVGK